MITHKFDIVYDHITCTWFYLRQHCNIRMILYMTIPHTGDCVYNDTTYGWSYVWQYHRRVIIFVIPPNDHPCTTWCNTPCVANASVEMLSKHFWSYKWLNICDQARENGPSGHKLHLIINYKNINYLDCCMEYWYSVTFGVFLIKLH